MKTCLCSAQERLNCYDALARFRTIPRTHTLTGVLEFCRAPGIQELDHDKTVEIPPGAQVSEPSATGVVGVTLVTLEVGLLERGTECVRVRAAVKENPLHVSTVPASSTIEYGASGMCGNPPDPRYFWMCRLITYRITVVEEFK
jgi:hypothetical protein